MENIPARNMNPPEYPDAPVCNECGAEMEEMGSILAKSYWECHNPLCEECPKRYRIDPEEE